MENTTRSQSPSQSRPQSLDNHDEQQGMRYAHELGVAKAALPLVFAAVIIFVYALCVLTPHLHVLRH